jgi:hypothetical protein
VIALIIILTGLLYMFYVIDALGIPLFIVFLILQLCGVITWSWVMVCLPLIIWGCAGLLTFITIAVISYISEEY